MIFLFVFFSVFIAFSDSNNNVLKNFYSEKIVPDVIDTGPKHVLQVKWFRKLEANGGNEVLPSQVKGEPKLSWPVKNQNDLFTLIFVDPDAPSRRDPSKAEFRHWIVINIPGNQVSKGETVLPYIGPSPPEGTGLHRYVLLIFKQKEKIQTSMKSRPNFKTQEFAKKLNLGTPVAGNFYTSQWHEE